MADKIIIALCEGPHDVSFINRILKTIGFVSNEFKKLKDFPSPMDKLMENEFTKTDIEQLNLQELRQGILPTHTLQKDNIWFFLYSMGGDGKKEPRKTILRNLKVNVRKIGEIKGDRNSYLNTQLSLIYIFDSDSKGLNRRLAEVLNEVKEVIPTLNNNIFPANSTFSNVEGIRIGCHIFTGNDNNTGKLEDILMPMLRDTNEDIFDNAEKYLQTHLNNLRLFSLKLANINGVISETRSIKGADKLKYDSQKSIVGVIGQLQKSGGSNTVCIGQTDYLTLDKISNSSKCNDFIDFVKNLII